MLKIIPIVLQVIAVAGGAYLGVSLKNGAPSSMEAAESAGDYEKADDKKKKKEPKEASKDKQKKKKDKGKKSGGKDKKYGKDAGDGSSSFMKFSRQFIVPVVARNSVVALVVFDINLEVDPSATENAYAREPKVRDAMLNTLLQLSNEGAFNDQLTHEDNVAEVRARLLASARSILGDDVVGVLILGVARQDM